MTLEEIRTEIDAIDSQMKTLFIRRMECAKRVAETKAKSGGDVFVPEREREIIEKRSSDIDAEIQDEYIAFLKQLMSICRRYEYGLLTEMQEEVLAGAVKEGELDSGKEHQQVAIVFCCSSADSNLNLFIDMARLNQIDILSMNLETQGELQRIEMVLNGNIRERRMSNLLCYIGKEAEDFKILALL